MGRRSVKENKSIYQLIREDLDLTREEASELIQGLSDDRIEKIESGKSPAHPDEVLLMAKAYKRPELYLNYCATECPIGLNRMPVVRDQDLEKTALEILDLVTKLGSKRERLISITADGVVSREERPDLDEICEELDRLSVSTQTLKLWIEKKLEQN